MGMIGKLPRDIFFDILSRLSIKDLIRCKNVCWQWRNSIKDPVFTSIHLHRAVQSNLCLVLDSDYPSPNNLPNDQLDMMITVDAFDEPGARVKNITIPFQSFVAGYEIVGSCNGFLYLYNSLWEDHAFIINPFTRECRELPRVSETRVPGLHTASYGFGFHPLTKTYKVMKVLIFLEEDHPYLLQRPLILRCEVWVLTFGSSNNSWRYIGSTPYRFYNYNSEALVEGKLHWLGKRDRLGEFQIISFDLDREEFNDVLQPDCGSLSPHECHLVALRGRLSLVVTRSGQATEIWIMEKETWKKEYEIGGYIRRPPRLPAPPIGVARRNPYEKIVKVFCQMEKGDILFSYKSRELVFFHPNLNTFTPLEIQGLPCGFQTIAHMGNLESMNAAFNH